MGAVFSNEKQYIPAYKPSEYVKRRPGKNIYKINKNKVFWRGERVEGAKGKEFTDLDEGYGIDTTYVFYKGFKLKTTDVRNFQVLKNKYAKDSMHVYYRGNIIPGADVDTFESDRYGNAFDDNYKYKDGKRTTAKRRSRR